MSKQVVRYQVANVPGKLRVELRITVDEKGVKYSYTNDVNDTIGNSITIYPTLSMAIVRPFETNEEGLKIKVPWNPNDSLGMTKFSFPIMLNALKKIQEDLKIPELYSYHGKRLEINEKLAESVRNVFNIGMTVVELSTIIIVIDEERVEGIKIKFNNESSTISLTLNELDSLIHNLDHLDIDSLSFLMYLNYIKEPSTVTNGAIRAKVDIVKPETDFAF